ncbi:Uncharacterised protein [Bordetella pertussis]|nr:Uncharacterised protein [Bordetella pertussis]
MAIIGTLARSMTSATAKLEPELTGPMTADTFSCDSSRRAPETVLVLSLSLLTLTSTILRPCMPPAALAWSMASWAPSSVGCPSEAMAPEVSSSAPILMSWPSATCAGPAASAATAMIFHSFIVIPLVGAAP